MDLSLPLLVRLQNLFSHGLPVQKEAIILNFQQYLRELRDEAGLKIMPQILVCESCTLLR